MMTEMPPLMVHSCDEKNINNFKSYEISNAFHNNLTSSDGVGKVSCFEVMKILNLNFL